MLSVNHMGCLGSNPGWLCLKQATYLLYYLSSSFESCIIVGWVLTKLFIRLLMKVLNLAVLIHIRHFFSIPPGDQGPWPLILCYLSLVSSFNFPPFLSSPDIFLGGTHHMELRDSLLGNHFWQSQGSIWNAGDFSIQAKSYPLCQHSGPNLAFSSSL